MKKDILCAAVIFCAVLIFTGAALMPGKAFLPADTTQFERPWSASAKPGADFHNTLIADAIVQSYPWRVHTMRLLRQGVVPLWNPYQFSGYPHAANNQSAVFYPPALAVFGLFGPIRGMAVNALLHLWLAGFGMFLFMRANHAGRAGALFSGLVLMSSGWFVSWLARPEFIQTAAWLPWLFTFFTIAACRRKPAFAAFGGIVLGTQLLGGHAQMAIYCVMALGLFSLFCCWREFSRSRAEGAAIQQTLAAMAMPLLYFIAISIAGCAIGAVQLLPTAELFRLAPRLGEAIDLEHVSPGFMAQLSNYINVFMPDFFGSPALKNVRHEEYNYVEMCAYCGVITLFLSGFAVAVRRRAFEAFFLALAALSLLLASGSPVLSLFLRVVPIMKIFTITRLILIFCFSVAALAGSGLDWIIAEQSQRIRIANWTWRLFQLIAICAAAAIIINLKLRPGVFPGGFWKCEITSVAKFATLLLLSALFLSSGAKFGGRWTASLCFLLLLVDTFTWGPYFNTTTDAGFVYPRSKLVDYLKSDRGEPYRFHAFSHGHILLMNSATAVGVEDIRGYDSIYYDRYKTLLRAYEERKRPGETLPGAWVSVISFSPELLQLLNVKYIMTEFDAAGRRRDLEFIGKIEGVYLYRYRDGLPRAFFVEKSFVESDGPRALATMAAGNFDPRKLAVLAEKPVIQGAATKPASAAQSVKTQASASGEITITASTPSPAILFISEIDYPGWQMRLDGKKTDYIRANYIFRAVALNSGIHKIEFKFRPASARIGLAISLASLLSLAGFLAINFKKHGGLSH